MNEEQVAEFREKPLPRPADLRIADALERIADALEGKR